MSEWWWRGIYRHLQKSNCHTIIEQLGETEVKTRSYRFVQNVATLGISMRQIYDSRWYRYEWPRAVSKLGETDSQFSEISSLVKQLTEGWSLELGGTDAKLGSTKKGLWLGFLSRV